ncbi:MAG: sigma-70 family RNA polymerase sigma factor [Sphingomonadaceae bacterium]|nr:sigma-70 family RNA polymerase sigma factor [Sphingomonadaceae bacterium]
MIHDHHGFQAAQAYQGDVADRVRRFMPMVRKLAWHLSGSASGGLEVEDLMQAGLVALTECAQKHDRPSEDGFAAYAKLRVRGAMVDLLRANSPDPRGASARRREIEQARRRLQLELGREPTAPELAGALGMDVEAFHRQRAELESVRLDGLEESYSDSNAAFASDTPDAEAALLQEEDREALIAAIAALPERLQMVVQLYFVEELNLSEIAAVLDVSVPRVHQLKASALAKLRLSLVGEELDDAA